MLEALKDIKWLGSCGLFSLFDEQFLSSWPSLFRILLLTAPFEAVSQSLRGHNGMNARAVFRHAS